MAAGGHFVNKFKLLVNFSHELAQIMTIHDFLGTRETLSNFTFGQISHGLVWLSQCEWS